MCIKEEDGFMVAKPIPIQRKTLILKSIEKAYKKWDGSAQKAVQIISENEELFRQLKEIDELLSESEKNDFLDKQQSKWKLLIQEHKKMVNKIQEEKNQLLEQMQQVNKKDNVVSNYIDKQQSLFVDRDA